MAESRVDVEFTVRERRQRVCQVSTQELTPSESREAYLTHQVQTLKKQLAQYQRLFNDNSSHVDTLTLQIISMLDEKHGLQSDLRDAKAKLACLVQKCQTLQELLSKRCSQQRTLYSHLTERIDVIHDMCAGTNGVQEALGSRIQALQLELNASRNDKNGLKEFSDMSVSTQTQTEEQDVDSAFQEREEKDTSEIEDINAAVRDLQDKKRILKEQIENLTVKLAHLKSLNETNKDEVQLLRHKVHEDEKLKEFLSSENKEMLAALAECISLAESQSRKIAELSQLKSLSEEHDSEDGRLREALQSSQDNEKILNEQIKVLTVELAHFKSLNETNEGEVKYLRDEVREHEELKEFLNNENMIMAEELANCESQSVELTEKNKQLDTTVQDLQRQWTETEQHIAEKDELIIKQSREIADLSQFKSLSEKHDSEDGRLREALQSSQDNEKTLNEQIEVLTVELAHFKTLNETNEGEVLYMRDKVCEHEELKELLDNENMIMAEELATCKSQSRELTEKNKQLETTVQDLQRQRTETEQRIAEKDELIIKQSREISDLSQLKSLSEKRDSEDGRLREALQSSQDNEKILNEQIKDLTVELAHFKSLNETNEGEVLYLRDVVCEHEELKEFLHNETLMVVEELAYCKSQAGELTEENKQLDTTVQDLQRQLRETEQRIAEKDELFTKQSREMAELSQLKSLSEKRDSEDGRLREALQSSQDNEKILNEQIEVLTVELAHFKSLNETNEGEVLYLRDKVCEHEELKEFLHNETSMVVEELAYCKSQSGELTEKNKQLETTVQDLQRQRTETEQRIAEKDELIIKQSREISDLSQLKSLSEKRDSEDGRLREALQSSQDNEKILNEQIKDLTVELAHFKSLNETNEGEVLYLRDVVCEHEELKEFLHNETLMVVEELAYCKSQAGELTEENKQLDTTVQDLQRQLRETEQRIAEKDELFKKQSREIAELSQLKSLSEKRDTEDGRLREALQSSQDNEKILNEQIEVLTVELAHFKSLNETNEGEVLYLRDKVCEHEELKEFLHNETSMVVEELAYCKSQAGELTEKNKQLDTTVQDLQRQLTETEQRIAEKDELIIKQSREIADLSQLKSLSEKRDSEDGRLREALQSSQDNEKILNDQIKDLTVELAHFKSLNETNEGEVLYLRDVVCENEELKEFLHNETLMVVEELAYCKSQAGELTEENKQLDTTVQDLQRQLRETEQRIAEKDELFTKQSREMAELSQLKSLSEKRDSEDGLLREALQSSQDNEKILNEQIEVLTVKLAHFKSLNETNEGEVLYLRDKVCEHEELKEFLHNETLMVVEELAYCKSQARELTEKNKQLDTTVHDLQCQLRETEQRISENDELILKQSREIADLSQLKSLSDGEISSLQAVVHNLQENEKILSGSLSTEREQAKSLSEKLDSEDGRLRAALQSSQDNEKILNEQIKDLTVELARFKSLSENQNDENKQMETSVQALQCQLTQTEQRISENDELITKQSREVADLFSNLQAVVNDLKDSKKILSDQIKNLTVRLDHSETLNETNQAEMQLLRGNVRYYSRLVTSEQQTDETMENPTAEPPAAEVQTRSLWCRCAQGLWNGASKAFSAAVTVGLLAPAYFLAVSNYNYYLSESFYYEQDDCF